MKTLSVFAVALHPEGVDRNSYTVLDDKIYFRRPHLKGADRTQIVTLDFWT